MFRKKVSCQICNTWFHKKCTQLSGKDIKLIGFNKFNSLYQPCFRKHVPFSHVNGSRANNKNLHNEHYNNSKTDFYNNCDSIEMPFDDSDHHTFINSKYYDINELNALNNRANYFGILHLNITFLNKHIYSLSNVLSMMKFNFPIIGLSEHKIRSNSLINNISLPGHTFSYDETKSTHGGTGFYINDKFSCIKRNDLNISLDNNLESTFIEVNLPKKRILSVGAFINTLICRLRILILSI